MLAPNASIFDFPAVDAFAFNNFFVIFISLFLPVIFK